ncbi:MAG: phospholipase [Chloroflexi bacterium]|nr:MAG: phospholipase [Chloroflexota bacterium]
MTHRLTRREVLAAGVAGGAALSAGSLLNHPLIRAALAAPPACGRLGDIEHVVILVQENRSFDHCFGSYRGVRGFADPAVPMLPDGSGLSVLAQPGYASGFDGDHLYPFHLDSSRGGECTNDINHGWGPQHGYWNGGRMDGFVRGHIAIEGALDGPLTMGHYTRSDLQFLYALADAFTVCDRYHCSVIGPTDPNRLYTMSASIDPSGTHGGPILSTSATRIERFGKLTRTTMPEQLEARGISWKVYASVDGNYGDNVLPYFHNILANPALAAKALVPSFPGSFELDCTLGTLPQVSWVLAPLLLTEHPPAPPILGEVATSLVMRALTGNPSLWARTALFVTYDENGGFFDHVPPPVPPPGTAGEFLSVSPLPSDAAGVAGPIGLGFRVPLLVISPFSRGGLVSSDVFDHTSLLRFIETRFGAEVPNLTAWRRSAVGDLTSAFDFAAPDASVPALPQPSPLDPRVLTTSCLASAPAGLLGDNIPGLGSVTGTLTQHYPVTVNALPPAQEPGAPRRPSGPVACAGSAPAGAGSPVSLLGRLGRLLGSGPGG